MTNIENNTTMYDSTNANALLENYSQNGGLHRKTDVRWSFCSLISVQIHYFIDIFYSCSCEFHDSNIILSRLNILFILGHQKINYGMEKHFLCVLEVKSSTFEVHTYPQTSG